MGELKELKDFFKKIQLICTGIIIFLCLTRLYGCNALHGALRDLKNMCAKEHDNLKFSQAKQWVYDAHVQSIWTNYRPMQKLFALVKNFPLKFLNKNLQINLHLFTVKQRQSLKTKLPFIIDDIFYFGFTYIRTTTESFRLKYSF